MLTSITLMLHIRSLIWLLCTPNHYPGPFSHKVQCGRQMTDRAIGIDHLRRLGPTLATQKGVIRPPQRTHSLKAVLTMGTTKSKLCQLPETNLFCFRFISHVGAALDQQSIVNSTGEGVGSWQSALKWKVEYFGHLIRSVENSAPHNCIHILRAEQNECNMT